MIMSIGTQDLFSLFFPEKQNKATHRVDNLKYNFHATIFKQNKTTLRVDSLKYNYYATFFFSHKGGG